MIGPKSLKPLLGPQNSLPDRVLDRGIISAAIGAGSLIALGTSSSSRPSARLEQEAHKFGLRDRLFSKSLMVSPQQMQIRLCIA
jgi:hypothetical protein